jgi:hypothetical protein
MIELEECIISNVYYRFIISEKDTILEKLKETTKKLAIDLENQKELKKKLEETVISQTKNYNEYARNIKA